MAADTLPPDRACFKAYDIRGRVPDQFNPALAYRIGAAFAKHTGARRVVVGRDMRLTGPAIAQALVQGLITQGVDVVDIGMCGTEEVYFATPHLDADGGIMVTASHNPGDYNGMKLVARGARPISGDTGLFDIRDLTNVEIAPVSRTDHGSVQEQSIHTAYTEHLLSYINLESLKPLRIVANPGNGMAGPTIERLKAVLPFEFVLLQDKPDGTFPNGVPNPLLESNRQITAQAVVDNRAELGVAWDGDFDRCFFFDADGRFIEGYYIVGLLADALLRKSPDAAVIHDPRLTWNTIQLVEAAGGRAVQSKTGHAFIKERMRKEDAVYGGEMSAHHYFRAFNYCDSGMIPWLLVAEMLCKANTTLAELVDQRIRLFPCSGEINRRVDDAEDVLARIYEGYAPAGDSRCESPVIDNTDGLSIEYRHWRFNVRRSNTEPLLRLNVETRADADLLDRKTKELLEVIGGQPAT
ncbi:MAG: phosphomannomutase [Pseudomonadota bacterium]